MRIDHLNLNVNDLKASVSFYSKVFDLSPFEKGTTQFGRSYEIIGDPAKFFFCLYQNPGLQNGRLNHWGVSVDDFEGFQAKIEQLGLEPLYDGPVDWGKSNSIYLKGPDGEEFEVSQRFGGGF